MTYPGKPGAPLGASLLSKAEATLQAPVQLGAATGGAFAPSVASAETGA